MTDNSRDASASTRLIGPSALASARAAPRPAAEPDLAEKTVKLVGYAVALEIRDRRTNAWRIEIHNAPGIHPAAAKFEVLRTIDWRKDDARVIGVAVPLGFEVLDKKGLILAA
jgi:hypothetical protein